MSLGNSKVAFVVVVVCLCFSFVLLFKDGYNGWGSVVSSSPFYILRGPYLQYPFNDPSKVIVVWESSQPSKCRFFLSRQGLSKFKQLPTRASGFVHVAAAHGLDENAKYSYYIETPAGRTRVYSFRTIPATARSYSFVVYGDSRWNHAVHYSLVKQMKRLDFQFIIHTGDIVTHGGNLNEYLIFFSLMKPIMSRSFFFPVIGNHDYSSGGDKLFNVLFFPPSSGQGGGKYYYYYFDTGCIRFIVLDNRAVRDGGSPQKLWLENLFQDARSRGIENVFVFFHQGIQSSGPHGQSSAIVGRGYLKLFQSYYPSLVMGGHDHIYERGVYEGLRYIVSGGGGAPLYTKERQVEGRIFRANEYHFILFKVDDCRIEFSVIRKDGSIIERCRLIGGGYNCNS